MVEVTEGMILAMLPMDDGKSWQLSPEARWRGKRIHRHLYRRLRMLVRMGLVRDRGEEVSALGVHRLYCLTPAGQAYLDRRLLDRGDHVQGHLHPLSALHR